MALAVMFDAGLPSLLLIAAIWVLVKTLWCGKAWRKERSPQGKVFSICIETVFCFLVYYYPFLLLALAWWMGWL